MDKSVFAEPLDMPRPAQSRQFDAFSPKLGRRVRFFGRSAQRAWVMLEADPQVKRFCERPVRVVINEHERVADFWVDFGRREALWLVDSGAVEAESTHDEAEPLTVQVEGRRIAVQRIGSDELRRNETLIRNWEQIVAYLAANRGFVEESLRRAVLKDLDRPRQLMTIERELSPIDTVLVRAALFDLLQRASVQAPSLATTPLSLTTLFRRAGGSKASQ